MKKEQLLEEISKIRETLADLQAENLTKLNELKIKYLSKKGIVMSLFSTFRDVPNEDKRELGKVLNELKSFAIERFDVLLQNVGDSTKEQTEKQDLTLPSFPMRLGTRHPLSIVRNDIVEIFSRLGFTVSEGPEIEDDWHVFSALNFPLEHPARDMQDTFFIEQNPDILLRTHTSSVQVHEMEELTPPIRKVTPGRVFRNEAISARAHCIFHQIEALYIDENVSFADLKQTLTYFVKEFFSEDTKIRLRPSYFPFTEPSAEMDISCSICGGKGCSVCKHTGWLEILGCGMVDPNVLDCSGIDSKKYTGFALGMGVERIAMLKYGITDLRIFFENDIRFLEQFNQV